MRKRTIPTLIGPTLSIPVNSPKTNPGFQTLTASTLRLLLPLGPIFKGVCNDTFILAKFPFHKAIDEYNKVAYQLSMTDASI